MFFSHFFPKVATLKFTSFIINMKGFKRRNLKKEKIVISCIKKFPRNKSGKIISKKKYIQGQKAFKNNQLKPKTAEEFRKINAAKKKNLF